MPLPERVRVKLLADDAGYISSARVLERDYTIPELLEALVSVAGKNAARLRQILRAGSVVVDRYRHRWPPIEASEEELLPLLGRFPDARPDRPFEPERCVHARIRAGVETLELARDEASRRKLFRRETFWDALMEVAVAAVPAYQEYSYHFRADVYAFTPDAAQQERLRDAAPLSGMERLEHRLGRLPVERIFLLVNR